MKKFLVLLILPSIAFLSCHKNKEADFIIPKNAELTVHGKDKMDIRASDVYSKYSELKRKIELINTETRAVTGEAYIILACSKKNENLYNKIKEDPDHFSGQLSIEINGQVVYSKGIINGQPIKGENLAYKKNDTEFNALLACNISTIHNCVASEIEGMNWVEYALCLVSAPGCYIKTWLSCQWEVCHNHIQYTNPN